MKIPTGDEVRALREAVRQREGLGITAAQDRCAAALYVTRRTWQRWEDGSRRMEPAFWKLAGIELNAAASRSP